MQSKLNRRSAIGALAAAMGASSLSVAGQASAALRRPMMSSASVHQAYVDTALGQIHYWTAGSGPNLLMIHQSGNSGEEYAGLIPYLADQFRLIAVDMPGHGGSDDPPRSPEVEDYGAAASAVIDALKLDRFSVLGHHGGAMVAMYLTAQHSGRVDKAILSGTSGLKTEEEGKKFTQSLQRPPTVIDAQGKLVEETWKNYVDMMSPGSSPETIFQPFLFNMLGRLRPYRAIDTYTRWDRRPSLNKVKVPTLLLQGDADPYVSKQENLLKILPDGSRKVMKDCGVFMFYEKPQFCAETIAEFLLA